MSRRRPRPARAAVVIAAVSLPLAACGGLPVADAEDQRYLDAGQALIEGDLADQIALGILEADCDGHDLDPGDTFDCTAASTGRRPIRFVATVSADGQGVEVATTNLLLADQVDQIETLTAALIAGDSGLPVTNEHVECADNSVVVGPGETIACLLTDPVDQTIRAVTVTVEDLNDLSIAVEVGDPVA